MNLFPFSQWLVELLVCSSALILLAWILTSSIGSWSAAVRHRVWFLTFGGLLVLPIGLIFLPSWDLPVLPPAQPVEIASQTPAKTFVSDRQPISSQTAVANSVSTPLMQGRTVSDIDTKLEQRESPDVKISSEPEPTTAALSASPAIQTNRTRSYAPWLIGFWIAGLIVCIVRFGIAGLTNLQISKHSQPVLDPTWNLMLAEFCNLLSLRRKVRLLESNQNIVPMTWGVARPIVALPAGAEAWSDSRRRAVLMHELAHIKRHDVLIQTVSFFVCALYWFHPLAWFGLRRLRVERELACDDCVVSTGQKPTEYARELVQIAKSFKFSNNSLGVAMAASSKLETRVVSLLDFARSHVPVSQNLSRGLVVGGLLTIIGLSTVRLGHQAITAVVAQENQTKSHVISGQVLDPAGQPLAGADVIVYSVFRTQPPHQNLAKNYASAVSDENGKYEIEISADKLAAIIGEEFGGPELKRFWRGSILVASKSGFGSDWQECNNKWEHKCGSGESDACVLTTTKPMTFKLGKSSVPINGRIVDLEGQPIAGATVRTTSIGYSTPEAIEAWHLKATKNPKAIDREELQRRSLKGLGNVPDVHYFPSTKSKGFVANHDQVETQTDSQGRFTFEGLGDDRKIDFEVVREGFASLAFSAITRELDAVPMPTEHKQFFAQTLFGNQPTIALQRDQPISGHITDLETGEPIPGIKIKSRDIVLRRFIDETGYATTDAGGRYTVRGIAKSNRENDQRLQLTISEDQPYFCDWLKVPNQTAVGPVEFDIKLRAGQLIRGKLVDQKTKLPVQGKVDFFPLLNNKNARQYAHYDSRMVSVSQDNVAVANDKGEFAVKGILGEGILVVTADEKAIYQVANGSEELGLSSSGNDGKRIAYLMPGPLNFNTLLPVDVKANSDQEFVVELVPLESKFIKVVNHLGDEVEESNFIYGQFPKANGHYGGKKDKSQIPNSHVEVFAVGESEQRDMLVRSANKAFGKAFKIDQSFIGPIVLKPCGTISGKIKSSQKWALISALVIEENPRRGYAAAEFNLSQAKPTADGSFELSGIPNGCPVTVRVSSFEGVKDVRITEPLRPGQKLDIGIVDSESGTEEVNFDPSVANVSMTESTQESNGKSANGQATSQKLTVGRVVDESGQPVANAAIAIIANAVELSQEMKSGVVVAESTTRNDGSFTLPHANANSKTHNDPKLIVRKKGHAIAWKQLDFDAENQSFEITLAPETLIKARLVGIEGNPAANMKLIVNMIFKEVKNSNPTSLRFNSKESAQAWLSPLETDQSGRFIIPNIPEGMGVWLELVGNEKFGPQDLAINTGISETREEQDGTYRPVVKNVGPDEEALMVVSAAKTFTGTIRYADTGKPVPHAKVDIWASQQEMGSMYSTTTTADAEGKYQLSPQPGIRFGVSAFPPSGAPYHGNQLEPINWTDGTTKKTLDVELPRGVLVKAVVRSKDSVDSNGKMIAGKPIQGAEVQYVPYGNNPHNKDNIKTGWETIQKTDKDGKFSICVIPGKGYLLAHGGMGSNYVLESKTEGEINGGAIPSGLRNYTHRFVKINLKVGSDTVELNPIELQPGGTANCSVVDEAGAPVDEFVHVSSHNITSYHLRWHGWGTEATNGKLKMKCLDPKTENKVYVWSPKRKIGATVLLKPGDTSTIVLKPFGSAKAVFLDKESGDPFEEYQPDLKILMKFGGSEQFSDLMVAADMDYTGNYDRLNHGGFPKTNAKGEFDFGPLIPGATYRLTKHDDGYRATAKTFVVESNKTIDLGNIKIKRPE